MELLIMFFPIGTVMFALKMALLPNTPISEKAIEWWYALQAFEREQILLSYGVTINVILTDHDEATLAHIYRIEIKKKRLTTH